MEIDGKKVVDAKKHLTVNVNMEDCSKGKTKDAAACAAAQAIMREHPEIRRARVHRGVTYIEREKFWERFLTPTSLKVELTVFDRGAKFMPGTHTLGAPSQTAQSLTAMRKARKDSRTGNHKAKGSPRPRHEISHIRARGANK